VIDASSGNDRPDALPAKALPDRLAVVSPVGVSPVEMLPRSARLTAYLGTVLDHGQNQSVVAGVRWGGVDHERHAVGVDEQRVLGSEFPAVNRARPRRIPTTESPHQNAVDHRQLGFKDARLPKNRPEVEMQSLPDPAGVRPDLSGADVVTAHLTRHAGADVVPRVSTHFLVAAHADRTFRAACGTFADAFHEGPSDRRMRTDRLRPSDRDLRTAAPPRGDFRKGLDLTVTETLASWPSACCFASPSAQPPTAAPPCATNSPSCSRLCRRSAWENSPTRSPHASASASRWPSRSGRLSAGAPAEVPGSSLPAQPGTVTADRLAGNRALSSATAANPSPPDRPLPPTTPRHRTA